MGRFQSCKGVVERALRRAFYDGVLELYEGHGSSDTVTAVALEGTLTLTINRAETLHIRLNEVAQRAEEIAAEDIVQYTHEEHHSSNQEKEKETCSKKRKGDIDKEEKIDKKNIKDKKIKIEKSDHEAEKQSSGTEPVEPKDTGFFQEISQHQSAENAELQAEQICVKKESRKLSLASESAGSAICRTNHEKKPKGKQGIPQTAVPENSSPTPSVERSSLSVKEEPKTESILIEDDDEDDSVGGDKSVLGYSRLPQMSPSQSLWYRLPRGSRQHGSSCHKLGKEHSSRKHYGSSRSLDASDPHEMALLLERNDCPVCGEVLHSRKELSTHLHAHRLVLRSTCSVCRANTLTLDALLLHLSTMHSPRVLPTAATFTSDALLSQALIPASPYTHGPMSAIASLVSMAACQVGSSSADAAAIFRSGAGMPSGMSSIMEQIIAYRGLLPCPICQLLCSSKQHLASHLTSIHGDFSSVSQGQDGFGDEIRSEGEAEGRQDSEIDSSHSTSFSCFDCSMGFSCQATYTQHCILQHGTTSVVSQGSCSVCHHAFDTWKALHSHYQASHSITNFCDRCKMGFVSASELKSHYDSVHSSETRSLTYVCDICNKGFYSQSQCSAHKRSHISEKSFACQVCGSAFFKRGDLSKHFRTVHAPNRVFACRFCGKRGTRMDNMRSHVKSHGKHMTRDEILSFIEEEKS